MVGRVCCRSFFFFCFSKCVRFFRLEGHLSNLTFQVWIHAFSIKNIHYQLDLNSKGQGHMEVYLDLEITSSLMI